MHDLIRVDTGGVIRPDEAGEGSFRATWIGDRMDVKDEFFLSASEEEISIPNVCAGYLLEHNSPLRISLGYQKSYAPSNLKVHPNAPLIAPRSVFEGRITFENRSNGGSAISGRMRQGVLMMEYLMSPTGRN
jgi:hypothetical protein